LHFRLLKLFIIVVISSLLGSCYCSSEPCYTYEYIIYVIQSNTQIDFLYSSSYVGSSHNSVDEALLLKRKSEEVLFHLNGRCIYLVGMMGSGKSTVGKILAEVLGYSCFDSDKLVEQAVGMPSVAQIFKVHSEAFFRENEVNAC